VKLDVHLMVTNPGDYVERVAEMGAASLAFHLDAVDLASHTDAAALVERIKQNGMKAGIVLNPGDTADVLDGLIEQLDFVVVMSIKPGFPGAKFLESAYDVIRELDKKRRERGFDFRISVDGGITPDVAAELPKHGADMLILGYLALFRPEGIKRLI